MVSTTVKMGKMLMLVTWVVVVQGVEVVQGEMVVQGVVVVQGGGVVQGVLQPKIGVAKRSPPEPPKKKLQQQLERSRTNGILKCYKICKGT